MTFLITGANRGIGLELAFFALENKHRVFALVRDPSQSRSLQHSIKENAAYGDLLKIVKCDITDANQIAEANEVVGAEPIDVLINNAGVLLDDDEKFSNLPLEKVELNFKVNALGSVAVTQAFLPNLLTAKNPKMICMTSQMGSINDNRGGGYYAYRMSKAALNMFVKSFSVDYPQITSFVLHPGWVRTAMGGPEAPVLPRESARGLFKIIVGATRNESGQFFDYTGKPIAW